jgi:streptomycin 6-kinase
MIGLHDQLVARAQLWAVTIGQTFETNSALLAFGTRHNSPVVLKISKQRGDEWHSGQMLGAFSGDGMVRVYESEPGAVLIERLVPGNDLVTLVKKGHDERTTQILAEVMQRLANHVPPPNCPTVFDWALSFDRYLQSGDQQVPAPLVQRVGELYRNLAISSSQTMLLHGDLHHYNVLFDEERGWTAIDPKGVVGELEYEVGAIIRNPMELPDLFTSSAVIERRLRTLTELLGLDYRRVLEWSFAQAVLSAIWGVEDGYRLESNHRTLKLANTIATMLGSPQPFTFGAL